MNKYIKHKPFAYFTILRYLYASGCMKKELRINVFFLFALQAFSDIFTHFCKYNHKPTIIGEIRLKFEFNRKVMSNSDRELI